MTSYKQKLRDRRWQKKRLEILSERQWECESCGCKDNRKQLEIHHGYYEKGAAPWDAENDVLWALCSSCHKRANFLQRALWHAIGKIPPKHLPAILHQLVQDKDTSERNNNAPEKFSANKLSSMWFHYFNAKHSEASLRHAKSYWDSRDCQKMKFTRSSKENVLDSIYSQSRDIILEHAVLVKTKRIARDRGIHFSEVADLPRIEWSKAEINLATEILAGVSLKRLPTEIFNLEKYEAEQITRKMMIFSAETNSIEDRDKLSLTLYSTRLYTIRDICGSHNLVDLEIRNQIASFVNHSIEKETVNLERSQLAFIN